MRAAALAAALLPSCAAAADGTRIDATLSPSGALSLGVDGEPWLRSGVTAMRHKAQWYVSGCDDATEIDCAPLELAGGGPAAAKGTDAVGEYTEQTLNWSGGGGAAKMVVGLRSYSGMSDVVSLVQRFPDGLEPQNNHGATNEVVSAFPTFGSSARDLGVLFFDGVQLQDSRYFPWAAGTPIHASDPGVPMRKGKPGGNSKDPHGNAEGGMPLLLVDSGSGAGLVFSPLSDFFTATQAQSKALGNWSFGMQATLQSAPPGHEHVTLVAAANSPRAAMMRWGDVFMRAAGAGKRRSMAWTESGDVGLKYLSCKMATLSRFDLPGNHSF